MIRNMTLPTAEKFLIYFLDEFAGKNGTAYPSQETLAKLLSVSVRHVRRLLASLRRRGILDWTSGAQSSRYRIDWLQVDRMRTPTSGATGPPGPGNTH